MKRLQFWLPALALALMASGVTFVITYTQATRQIVGNYESAAYESEAANKAAEVQAYIDTFFIGEYDEQDLSDALSAAMVEATGDRWSYYISADELETYYENVTNSYVGIGVTVQVSEEDGGLLVQSVTPGSPAALAGVKPMDVITAVEGEPTIELGLEESKARIRGEEGTDVTITVRSGGTETELTLTRSSIETEVVSYELLDGGVGYIQILNFEQNCASQTIAAIEDLTAQGAQSLLFDVRFNPGGLTVELCEVLDYLLPEGVIFQSVDVSGEEEIIRSDAACIDLPMAVLVNADSYSAAEFFAAALQEYGVAEVVGVQTCGKGYYQRTYVLSDGSALALSSGAYFTPNGVSLAGVGITPDQVVELDDEDLYALLYNQLAKEDDAQLQAALDLLAPQDTANVAE